MPETAIDYATLPQSIALAIATFMAITASFNKWAESRKADATHVGILEKDRAYHEERADIAEAKAEKAWQRLDEVAKELSEMKIQNARLSERVDSLTRTNQELTARLEEFMRAAK